MKSKIHPFAVIFTIVTILLSIPTFMVAYNFIDDYTKNPANIFIVIMIFFGLFSISFFVFGWRNIRQLKINENSIEEKWLGRWITKLLINNNETNIHQKTINYKLFKVHQTTIEDQLGKQIHFSNLDFRNYKDLNSHLKQHSNSTKIKIKTDWINRIFIGLFITASIWMIVTGSMKIIF